MAASIRLGLRPCGRAVRLHTAAEAAAARYPPVVASLTAKSKAARQRRVDRWHERAHAAPSVAAKLRVLTKLQRLKYVVHPQTFALHADRWYQSFTRTAYLSGLPLPRPPGPGQPGGPPDLAPLRSAVRDCLLQEHVHLKRKKRAPQYRQQEFVAAPFLQQLVASLTGLLTPHNPCLSSAALDFKRPVHFYWCCGEEIIPKGHRRGRVDALRYQIDDKPHSQIRIQKQLSEFVPLDYSVPVEIPVLNCKPDKLPLFKRQYENKIFIGTRLADPCCYGHTQFHLLPDKIKRERLLKDNRADQIEVGYRANAIASLYAWTGAQAMYQGFWSEADVTRPFVSQGVVTDGKYFAFFCYQLNTLALTEQAAQNNPRKNICWGTESMPLFEVIEDGDVKGFNDELLLQLVQFLMNRPEEYRSQSL